MKKQLSQIPIILLGLILLLLPTDFAQATEKSSFIVLAADVFELNLDFDTTMDILGETRFFSSRHNKYVGGRFMVHMGAKSEESFYVGTFTGIVWGKSGFLMNWEEPGLQSFEPLESSVSTFAWPFGVDFNLKIGGFLGISPYASAKMMILRLKLEIGDEDFSGSVFKLGFDAGVRVSLDFGSFTVTGGAGLTHILNGEIEFELDDVEFDSKTSGSSPEYFLGVEL